MRCLQMESIRCGVVLHHYKSRMYCPRFWQHNHGRAGTGLRGCHLSWSRPTCPPLLWVPAPATHPCHACCSVSAFGSPYSFPFLFSQISIISNAAERPEAFTVSSRHSAERSVGFAFSDKTGVDLALCDGTGVVVIGCFFNYGHFCPVEN